MPAQRTLAAVVFTDAVGFTRRTGENEEEALRLVGDDFAVMRQFVAEHGGQVKKNTGDGLLMVFPSAVQAVLCAIEIQKRLSEHRQRNPRAFEHRIGIHLGDVMLTDDDVYGDGVNIASRLQVEAQPGGITLSQTIYDVVRTKIPVQARFAGDRLLKNVAEAMPVYEISATPAARPTAAPVPVAKREVAPTPPVSNSRSSLVIGLVAVGVAALAIGAFAYIGSRKTAALPPPQVPKVDTSDPQLPEIGKRSEAAELVTKNASPAPPDTSPLESQEAATQLLPSAPAVRKEYEDARKLYKQSYNFQGMLTWVQDRPWADSQGGARLVAHWKRLVALRENLLIQLNSHSADNPVKVGTTDYWLTGNSVSVRPAGAEASQQELSQLKADELLGLAKAVGLDDTLQHAFAVEYGLAGA